MTDKEELIEENRKAAERELEREIEESNRAKQIMFRVGLAPIVELQEIRLSSGEKHTIEFYHAQYKGFSFRRARSRSYWHVDGPMPVRAAEEMYQTPVGKSDIRVMGHCCCVAPEGVYITYRNDAGKEMVSPEQYEESANWVKRHPNMYSSHSELVSATQEECERFGTALIESYHIDTELGLYMFIQKIDKLINGRMP